ncbi:MAG: hypothetical protein R3D70_05745 [Rhizobiaceae bacterium]
MKIQGWINGACPPALAADFWRLRRFYKFHNGYILAACTGTTYWRDTGEWAGVYAINVRTDTGVYTETYVWVKRGRRFQQIRQFNVPGNRPRKWREGL